jgi:hypothetical protein
MTPETASTARRRHRLTGGDAAFERPTTSVSRCGLLVFRRLDHGYNQFGQFPGE